MVRLMQEQEQRYSDTYVHEVFARYGSPSQVSIAQKPIGTRRKFRPAASWQLSLEPTMYVMKLATSNFGDVDFRLMGED